MRIFYVRRLPTNDIVRFPFASSRILQSMRINHECCTHCVPKSIHIYQLRSAEMFKTRKRIVYLQTQKKKKNEGNANRVAKEKVETPTHEENIQPFYDTHKLTMNGGESNEEDFLTYNFVFVFFFYFAHRNTSTRVLFLSAKNETVRMTCVFVLVWYKFTGRLAKSRAEEDNRFLLLPQLVEDYIDRQFLSVRGQNTRTTTSSSSAGKMRT